MNEWTQRGFTRAQADFLEKMISSARRGSQTFDRPTMMWLFGGIVALGIAASGVLYAEIRANRDEARANRDAIAELAKGQARIEAILEERLPRLK